MKAPALLVTAAVLSLLTVASVATGSTTAPAKKQRVAIEGIFDTGAGKGTFRLVPLTPGPIKPDAGTFTGGGEISPAVVRNGQEVTVITGVDRHTGKHGSFTVTQRLTMVTVGGPLAGGARYRIVTGTWSFGGGTGDYEGVVGQGAYSAIQFPRYGNNVRFSEEGILRGR
jgi:hypothetical protein